METDFNTKIKINVRKNIMILLLLIIFSLIPVMSQISYAQFSNPNSNFKINDEFEPDQAMFKSLSKLVYNIIPNQVVINNGSSQGINVKPVELEDENNPIVSPIDISSVDLSVEVRIDALKGNILRVHDGSEQISNI